MFLSYSKGGFFEATLDFLICFEMFESMLFDFYGVQAILMALVVRTTFFNWNGVKIITKYGLEVDFCIFCEAIICANIFCL